MSPKTGRYAPSYSIHSYYLRDHKTLHAGFFIYKQKHVYKYLIKVERFPGTTLTNANPGSVVLSGASETRTIISITTSVRALRPASVTDHATMLFLLTRRMK